MKKILLLFSLVLTFVLAGCESVSQSEIFEKRKICHDDAIKHSNPEFVFYSPEFNACVQYFCVFKKMDPDKFDMKITPGCELEDLYTDKFYEAFSCKDKFECHKKLNEYK